MSRASGANSQLLFGFEAAYGAATAPKYIKLPFVSNALGGDQALIASNLLGRGREPQDPILDVVNDSGDIAVPVDQRNIWYWLNLLMGAPVTTVVAASMVIPFTAQPAANSTITLNGTAWTFVPGAPVGNQIQIGANLGATLTAAAAALNASAEAQTVKCAYTASATALTITNKTAGWAGNTYTVAGSGSLNGTPPNANLTGGGNQHVWTSGASSLPSAVLESGFPEVPSYGRNQGCLLDTMKLSLASSGLLDATMSMIGQKETTYGAPVTANPAVFDTIRFGQLTGSISRNGSLLGGITAGDFSYANTFDQARVIRPDGAIDGADPGVIAVTGTITSRFQDTVLLDQASSQLPCDISYGWSTPSGAILTIDTKRVFLPRPKRQVSGPTGISVSYAWHAALDSVSGCTCQITLINDISDASYLA